MAKAIRQRHKPETELQRFYSLIKQSPQSDMHLFVEQMTAILDDADFWSDSFIENAAETKKHYRIRQMIRLLKSEADDFPLFANRRFEDAEGKVRYGYKPFEKFNRKDYIETAADWTSRTNYDLRMCVGLNKLFHNKYGEQLAFNFDFPVTLPKAK